LRELVDRMGRPWTGRSTWLTSAREPGTGWYRDY
jgi:hypothetical protein